MYITINEFNKLDENSRRVVELTHKANCFVGRSLQAMLDSFGSGEPLESSESEEALVNKAMCLKRELAFVAGKEFANKHVRLTPPV